MLVQEAERLIHLANPPVPADVAGARKGGLQEPTLIPRDLIHNIRASHTHRRRDLVLCGTGHPPLRRWLMRVWAKGRQSSGFWTISPKIVTLLFWAKTAIQAIFRPISPK